MRPVRHALGALLLEQGRVEETLVGYRADLGFDSVIKRSSQHPDNVWSLSGYHECLERTCQHELAAVARQRLTLAQARADLPVHASCFCRLPCASRDRREVSRRAQLLCGSDSDSCVGPIKLDKIRNFRVALGVGCVANADPPR